MSIDSSALLALVGRPWVLPLVACVAAVIASLAWRLDAQRRLRLSRLGDSEVVQRLLPNRARAAIGSRWRAVLLGGAALLIGLALAGPQWGRRSEQRTDVGIDVALVLDVSASMLATDEGASRLQRMKDDVQRLLVTMPPSSRVALLIVAGRSYVLTPLTADQDALMLFLDGLEPSMVSQGGTALADGLQQALRVFGSGSGDDRAVVLMSDGETWDDEAAMRAAANALKAARVSLITVSYGSRDGASIPVGRGEFKRDQDGAVVITRADPAALRALATDASGVFVDGASADRPGRVLAALRRLRQTERTYGTASAPIQRYAIFLWPALLLLCLDAVLAIGWRRRKLTRAVVAALALVVAAPSSGHAQARAAEKDAQRLRDQRRAAEVALSLREGTRRGDLSARTQYNLASALLDADSAAAAVQLLERVVAIAPDAELRFRALFNLGLAQLRRARATKTADGSAYAASAVAAYKRAMRTRMDDADARWNLELSLREQERGGGGGGERDKPSAPPQSSGAQPAPAQLEQQRAAAVLSSAGRDERSVQSKRQRDGQRREAPAGRDW
jgi:Ca-activated chloride channel homolog